MLVNVYYDPLEAELWVAVCLGSVATVFVSAALLNSIGRLDAPFMTLPFNFIAIISFLNFQTDSYMPPPPAVEEAVNTTMADNIRYTDILLIYKLMISFLAVMWRASSGWRWWRGVCSAWDKCGQSR